MAMKPRRSEYVATPVNVIPETEIIKSSNTWEFLLFEQLRGIRFIQLTIFTEPDWSRYKILNLILAVNHLETLAMDKLDPRRDRASKQWIEYNAKKPDLFKDLDSDKALTNIRHLAAGDEISQLKLCAMLQKWISSIDKYLSAMKKVDVESYDMRVPEDELIPTKV